jgi:epsilon-lactone hydrolase
MTRHQPGDLLGQIYAEWTEEFEAVPDMSLRLMRIVFEDWQRATAECPGVSYEHTEIGGVPGIRVLPEGADPRQMLVLMHGGGFALGSSASHRKMAAHIAKACGAHAFVVDFRLAPENKYPAAIDDGLAVIDGLLEHGLAMSDITLVGDSAGGNLALAMVLRLQGAGRELPRQVITISPWLNMLNDGETIETNNDTDFLITREGLQGNIDRYIEGAADPTDPLVNPLYADLGNFPRLYICAGDSESLFSDSVRLNALAEKHGVDVTFSVGEGQQHVYPFMAGRHPAADKEIAAIASWYRAGR